MLERVRIENFKAWRDTGELEFAPLTILFGPNSSGKSSINHLLMLLKQTVRSADRNSVLDLGDPSSPVDLGSFRDLIFRHQLRNRLRFELEWSLDTALEIRDPRSRHRYYGDRLAFRAEVRQPEASRVAQSEGFRYELRSRDPDTPGLDVNLTRDPKRPSRWKLVSENYDFVRTTGRAWELPRPVQFYGFPNEALVYFQNSAFLSDLEFNLEAQIGRVSYLGPLRSPPARRYTWGGGVPEDVGLNGGSAVQALLSARERSLNFRPRARTRSLETVVAEWLQEMGLISTFDVVEIAPDSDLFEVRVRVGRTSEEVKLTDVGFGVSQVLPVVVQCFYAPANSTVLMEQPELHLHPSVQASLADLFIAAVTARERGKQRRVQLVVESHSEHLLRRLLRRIAEERVRPEDVAMYMCTQTRKGSAIERLEVDEYGDVLNWPPDFFGNELEDVAIQAEIGIQRRLKV
jgi:predicted ATPase